MTDDPEDARQSAWLVVLPVVLAVATAGVAGATAAGAVHQSNATGGNESGANETVTPPFAPTVFEDVAGQVATEDGTVGVSGVARGQDEVLVIMIDRRGQISSTILSVDDDDRFEEDDLPLVTPADEELSEGPVVAAVFGVGRDGVVGDGEIAGFTRADLEALDEGTRQRVRGGLANGTTTRTQQQVLELFYEESVGEAGSDDLVLVDAFRYTDGRTGIESVYPAGRTNATGVQPVPAGETVVVQGVTNRKPDDTTVTVEAVDGPTPDAISIAATDSWGLDGVWTVTLDTAGVEPGTYTIEADDGDDTDRVQVEVVSPGNGTAANVTAGANPSRT